MTTLYKRDNNSLFYCLVFPLTDIEGMIYSGKVGEIGVEKKITADSAVHLDKVIDTELASLRKEGYNELNNDHFRSIEIEYPVVGMGTDEDLDMRYALEEKLDVLLKFTGLGFSNGGSMGSGTMEVGCKVVDFDLAKRLIEEHLKDTEFANYSRIFRLGESSMN